MLVGSRVSRRHARIDVSPDAAVAHDLGSKNGTSVNGERLSAPRVLRDGDVIEIGASRSPCESDRATLPP